MKDFMFIFRNAAAMSEPTPEEMQSSMQDWLAWIDKLKAQGTYASGEALIPGGKLVKGNKPVITDGPFAESKELVGGYFIIKADSMDAAAEIARDCPDLSIGGSVEVREVMVF